MTDSSARSGPTSTWCCHTPMTGPHTPGCTFEPREDQPVDYAGGFVWGEEPRGV